MKNTTKLLLGFAILATVNFLLIACDNESDSDIFIVTFNSNGGSAVPSQEVPDGGKAAKPKGVSQQVNFALEGWYTDNNTFENKWNFDMDTVIEDITLYARWQAVSTLDYEDFGPVLVTTTYTVANAVHWINAVDAISNGGDDKAYIINITGDFSIEGIENYYDSYSYRYYYETSTFSEINDVTVSLRSDGKIITLSDDGNSLLCMWKSQNLIIRNVNLLGNNSNGSIVYIEDGIFSMHGGEIKNNMVSEDTIDYADGVYINKGNFTMYSGKISGNNCCGVHISEGTFIMYNGEISGNEGTGVSARTFTMHNGKISNNEGTGVSAGTFTMYNGKISNNEGTGVQSSNFTMHNGEISGNGYNGVRNFVGSFIMNGGTISNNTNIGVSIYVQSNRSSSFIMNEGIISGNLGGGVSTSVHVSGGESNIIMNGGTISGNTAEHGGGVYLYDWYGNGNINFTMNGGTISGNSASGDSYGGGYGGGVYAFGANKNFTMTGGIISGNTAYTGGGVCAGKFFTKYGGIIYGENEGVNSNIVSGGNTCGYAVYMDFFYDGKFFTGYRNTTLGEDDYITTSNELPEIVGETLNGWTR